LFTFQIKDEKLNELNLEMCQQGDAIGRLSVDIRSLSIEQTTCRQPTAADFTAISAG
jgi:hypothetical protein